MTMPTCTQEISSKGLFGSVDTCVQHMNSPSTGQCITLEQLRSIFRNLRETLSNAPSKAPSPASLLWDPALIVADIMFVSPGMETAQKAVPERFKRAFSVLKWPAVLFVPSFRSAMIVTGIASKIASNCGKRVVQAMVGQNPLAGVNFQMG